MKLFFELISETLKERNHSIFLSKIHLIIYNMNMLAYHVIAIGGEPERL